MHIEGEMLNHREGASLSSQDSGEIAFHCDYVHQCLVFGGKSIFIKHCIARYSNFIDLMPIWGETRLHFSDPWWG